MMSDKAEPIQPAPRGSLRTEVLTPKELVPDQRSRMYDLMDGHFSNIQRDRFQQDLDEKNWVVVIADAAGTVQGFTTLALLERNENGRTMLGFYSGDTVLAPGYWGEHAWLGVWSRHVFETAERRPDCDAYWILLTATHRTYRFLPAFFREFYPNPDKPTPDDWRRRLCDFVRMKFPDEHDADSGVVRLREPTPVRHPDRVRADLPENDRHAAFFARQNPGYLQSDFLACITQISRANTTPLGNRVLRTPRVPE